MYDSQPLQTSEGQHSAMVAKPIAAHARWPPGLVIRPQSPDDATEIAAIQSLPGVRAGTLRPPYPRLTDIRQNIECQSANTVILVAVLDHLVVGNASLTRLSGRRGHVGQLGMAVHDAYQGRGIGRALLGELVAVAFDWMHITRLELTVFTDNAPAIALYRSLGFEQEGLHKAYALRAGTYVDALAMARIRA